MKPANPALLLGLIALGLLRAAKSVTQVDVQCGGVLPSAQGRACSEAHPHFNKPSSLSTRSTAWSRLVLLGSVTSSWFLPCLFQRSQDAAAQELSLLGQSRTLLGMGPARPPPLHTATAIGIDEGGEGGRRGRWG